MMRIGFWICMACMIPGLLIRVPVGGAGILLSDFILPLFAAFFVFYQLFWKRSLPRYYFLGLGLLFGLIAIISWILGAWPLEFKEQIISFSYIVRWISLIVFGAAAGELYGGENLKTDESRNLGTKNSLYTFLKGLWIIIAIILLIGFLQFFLIPDIGQFSTVGGFDPHTGRFLGTWMDPNFVAGLLAFFVPLMMGHWYSSPGYGTWSKGWLSILIVLSLVALFLTFSRSGYLAAGLGVGLFLLFRKPQIIVLGILMLSIGIATNPRANQRAEELFGTIGNIVFQESDEIDPTAMLRFESWEKTLELWEKYPIFGIGYNTYRYIASEEGLVDESYFSSGGSDSSLLTVLVTTGIVGFITFMLWYLQIWFHHLRKWYKSKFTPYPLSHTPYELHLGIWAGWSALFLHSFFVNSMLFPLILMPIMAVVGILRD
ncbi:MAG TPA: O-antigen ligase family protein [Candidatus Gracilibacteria bacterium]